MKRNARFNLRMTQAEMEVLLQFAGEGNRSEFIRRAIELAIETKKGRKMNGVEQYILELKALVHDLSNEVAVQGPGWLRAYEEMQQIEVTLDDLEKRKEIEKK